MDVVFNHSIGLTAIRNGNAQRLNFGCQEKVANVTFADDSAEKMLVRSHHDLVLADGTVLKSVPSTSFRTEHPRSNAETATSSK